MNKVVLFDIDYTIFDTALYKESNLTVFQLYEEVLEVLTEIGRGATVGIFSQGETEHQLKKLLQTNLYKQFKDEHIHIFIRKMESLPDVLLKYKGNKLFFIDDKLEVLKEVKDSDQTIFTVWIKRGEYAENAVAIPGFKPDAEMVNLRDLISIVDQN